MSNGSVKSEKVTFTGSLGDTLAARLDRPAGPVRAYALFAHCFTCSKDVFAASRIAGALAERGIAVLRFDFTGLGMSEGDFANTNFSSNVADLVAAADFMREAYEAPGLLVGHSLGGAAVLAAAASVPEAVAVATIGAPSTAAHVADNFGGQVDTITTEGEAEVELAGRSFTIRKQFLDDIAEHTLADKIANLKKALIVFHAPRDQQVGIDNAAEIFQAAKHPKSFISLDDADHLLTRRADAIYVADVLCAWASRYLGAEENETAPGEHGTVVVEETGAGKFQQRVTAGRHVFFADEPRKLGGDDTGPTPYDLLLAGLGACTAMTMRLYAAHKGLEVGKVSVRLQHEEMHADDCAECAAEGSGKIDVIRREIGIDGDITEDQRRKLLEIADKCPVHRTLESDIEVLTRLAP
ncbi:MAG: alpha/beta fold hydrolase [Kangiella sp.]|nr:alpha/beta fold hydrolase [Kangiella sp.]